MDKINDAGLLDGHFVLSSDMLNSSRLLFTSDGTAILGTGRPMLDSVYNLFLNNRLISRPTLCLGFFIM